MKKYVLGAVLSLGILASPLFASAAGLTGSQISAIMSLLQAFGADQSVITNVQISLSGGTPTSTGSSQFCYNFFSDLSIGAGGSAVTALQTALQKDGESVAVSGIFDEQTASAVSGFQERYASDVLARVGLQHGTGYVGSFTRTKLNALYGCGNNQPPLPPPVVIVPPQPVPVPPQPIQPTITLFSSKDPNPTTGAVTLVWQTSSTAIVNIEMVCTSGSISFTTDKGSRPGCDKGGVWYQDGQSSGAITITPSGNVNPVTVPFTLNVLDQIGASTNQKQTIYVTFPVITATQPPLVTPSITVLSPNGGESFMAGQGSIRATYQSSNIAGQQLTAYLYSPILGNVRSVSGYASSNGSIDISLDKGSADDPAGQYKINICANNIDNPAIPGKSLCDLSDNYFTLVVPLPAPTIDSFSVNGNSQVLNGKINVYNSYNPTVQWTSTNASYCKSTSVEGISRATTTDFTGTQPTSGSIQLMIGDSYYNQREITLTCYNQNGVPSNTVVAWIGAKG